MNIYVFPRTLMTTAINRTGDYFERTVLFVIHQVLQKSIPIASLLLSYLAAISPHTPAGWILSTINLPMRTYNIHCLNWLPRMKAGICTCHGGATIGTCPGLQGIDTCLTEDVSALLHGHGVLEHIVADCTNVSVLGRRREYLCWVPHIISFLAVKLWSYAPFIAGLIDNNGQSEATLHSFDSDIKFRNYDCICADTTASHIIDDKWLAIGFNVKLNALHMKYASTSCEWYNIQNTVVFATTKQNGMFESRHNLPKTVTESQALLLNELASINAAWWAWRRCRLEGSACQRIAVPGGDATSALRGEECVGLHWSVALESRGSLGGLRSLAMVDGG